MIRIFCEPEDEVIVGALNIKAKYIVLRGVWGRIDLGRCWDTMKYRHKGVHECQGGNISLLKRLYSLANQAELWDSLEFLGADRGDVATLQDDIAEEIKWRETQAARLRRDQQGGQRRKHLAFDPPSFAVWVAVGAVAIFVAWKLFCYC